jgi:hypothetical protein
MRWHDKKRDSDPAALAHLNIWVVPSRCSRAAIVYG